MAIIEYKHIHLHKVFVAIVAIVFTICLFMGIGTFLSIPSISSRHHKLDESRKSSEKEGKELDPETIKAWELICNRPNSGYFCCQKGAAFCAETVSPQYLP